MIIDFPNEDPKIFSISDFEYFSIASKRSFIFNFLAIICMFFILWVFHLRLTHGNCGGYKTIVRKPSKEIRHKRIRYAIFSSLVVLTGLAFSLGFLIKVTSHSNQLGRSLVAKNKLQFLSVIKNQKDSIYEKIRAINKRGIEVKYSSQNYETF